MQYLDVGCFGGLANTVVDHADRLLQPVKQARAVESHPHAAPMPLEQTNSGPALNLSKGSNEVAVALRFKAAIGMFMTAR